MATDDTDPVRVLLVEDDEDDYLITREMLARQDRVRFSVDWRAHYRDGLEAIREQRHDVYLIDYRLGEHTGLELVREGFAARPFAPVIMLTGQAAYEIDLEATDLGVTDYLVKQELDPLGLERSIRYAISNQKAQLRLRHDALHDTLTGLPNRTLFMDRVNQILQRAIRDPQTGCAVLFLDIDRFKLVNDSLSHAVGDNLLIALAGRVSAALRPGDTVARLGGDEFTVLLEDIVDADDATVVAGRILSSLDEAFVIDGNELFVSASIGISLSAPGLGPADLMRNADIAMYDAKRRGRARSAVFDESMHRRVVDRLARETELRQVVECSLLAIHYQPIIDLSTGAICGLEALARWPADWPHVAPSEFISIAEETGVIGALGQHVMRNALATLSGWRQDGLISDDVCMSVNLSGRQLDDPGLAEQVRAAINSAQLPPNALKLEITESTLMQEVERTQHVFSEVCGSGVGLHLDDFGTGYSSLTALHRFPVDALKIDRSFVSTISEDADNDVIVRSTVALAHSLGLTVIAEGIECPDQLRRLRSLGCEFGQGYLFSPALSAEGTCSLIESWSAADILALGAPA